MKTLLKLKTEDWKQSAFWDIWSNNQTMMTIRSADVTLLVQQTLHKNPFVKFTRWNLHHLRNHHYSCPKDSPMAEQSPELDSWTALENTAWENFSCFPLLLELEASSKLLVNYTSIRLLNTEAVRCTDNLLAIICWYIEAVNF